MPGHLGAVSLKKSHDIVILSICNIVKGQAKCIFAKVLGLNAKTSGTIVVHKYLYLLWM